MFFYLFGHTYIERERERERERESLFSRKCFFLSSILFLCDPKRWERAEMWIPIFYRKHKQRREWSCWAVWVFFLFLSFLLVAGNRETKMERAMRVKRWGVAGILKVQRVSAGENERN
jgi:hypothetical protein